MLFYTSQTCCADCFWQWISGWDLGSYVMHVIYNWIQICLQISDYLPWWVNIHLFFRPDKGAGPGHRICVLRYDAFLNRDGTEILKCKLYQYFPWFYYFIYSRSIYSLRNNFFVCFYKLQTFLFFLCKLLLHLLLLYYFFTKKKILPY